MKIIVASLILLLLILQYKLWGGDDGVPDVLQIQKEVDLAKQEEQRLQERNNALAAEVRDLKQGLEAIEERARTELGMIRNDETYYQIVIPEQSKPATNTPLISD